MHAPLLPADVELVLRDDLGAARTLPADAYTTEQVLGWERAQAFDGGWICVGRSDALRRPGDQYALRAGDDSVLLAREKNGELHAFYNVCRHHGHELLGCGESKNRSTVRCPYHAWVYNLDGTLRSATRFTDTQNFDTASWPLVEIRCAEWNGWVFLNRNGTAPEFTDWVGNLDEILAAYDITSMRIATSHDYVVQANWKSIVENYLECYHCPSIHPELCRVSPPDSAQAFVQCGYWLGGPMELRDNAASMSLDGSGRPPLPGLNDTQRRSVCYFVLPANLLISAHPDYVMTHRLYPLSPTETAVECAWLFPESAIDEDDFDPSYAAEFWDITNRQDFGACESVARGLASAGYRPGPFDAREDGVRAFQEQLGRLYITGAWHRARGAVMGNASATLPTA